MIRTPLPLPEQIKALRNYMRTLRADINRASRESSRHYLKRRICPFVDELRYRRIMMAYELESVAQECVNELRHARALSIAEFAPGTCITMEVVMKHHERPPERYIIYDVRWSKPDSYHYEVWQLTKSGELFKRGTTWLCPSDRIRIKRCDETLTEETRRMCEHVRERARRFAENTHALGKLDEIVERVRKERDRRGY